jgi:enterochelin esterase-like enzyme
MSTFFRALILLLVPIFSISLVAQETQAQAKSLQKQLANNPFGAQRLGSNQLRIFYFSPKSEIVRLEGTFSLNMRPFYEPGYGVWVADFKLQKLREALLTFKIYPSPDTNWPEVYHYRGSAAPKPVSTASGLKGTLHHQPLDSVILGEARVTSIYLPNKPAEYVLFFADTEHIRQLAFYVDPLILADKLPPVALAGVTPASSDGSNANLNPRSLELLEGLENNIETTSNGKFERFLQFYLEEFKPWAIRHKHLPQDVDRHILVGFSDSASFAISAATKNSQSFSKLMVFSPLWRSQFAESPADNAPPAIFVYGELEGSLGKNIRSLADRWSQKGEAKVVARVSGHDEIFWYEELIRQLLTELQ